MGSLDWKIKGMDRKKTARFKTWFKTWVIPYDTQWVYVNSSTVSWKRNFEIHYQTLCFPMFVAAVQSLSQSDLWDPMDCSIPAFPVLHYLPEFAQTHVHWANDAIQISHPLLPLLLLLSVFLSFMVFSNELALHIRWPKYLSFSFSISPSNEYSRLISYRID